MKTIRITLSDGRIIVIAEQAAIEGAEISIAIQTRDAIQLVWLGRIEVENA